MKLQKVKEKLLKKELQQTRKFKKEFKKKEDKNINELKIIGVTGSTGKSSTCVMLHEYLKSLGYKSVLYSSAMVDSPVTYIDKTIGIEIALRSEQDLFNIIEEVEAYEADYLILEVNESVLEKHILDDIDFDVKVLTNLNPFHSEENYSEEEYVELKKSFFRNTNKDTKCVIGFQCYNEKLLNELLKLTSHNDKYLFSTDHILKTYQVNKNFFDVVLQELFLTLDGLNMEVKVSDEVINFKTKLLMKYNAFNILATITTLQALNLFDVDKFKDVIYDIKVGGRSEVINMNNRLILIDTQLDKPLECLKELKEKGLINQIKVVVGSVGYGYKHWDEKFKSEEYINSRVKYRKYAMGLLKDVDYVYLTECDSGAEDVQQICLNLKSYLGETVNSEIILDRVEAIKEAITCSNEKDAIFIAGRGNKRTLCDGEESMKFFKDSEIVEEVLEELTEKGWF
ncbi:MAG: hypothetical protein J6K18_00025 [Bacilli bacterium]|nr:hypothetical protein [Bacilli bacterium]